MKKATSPDPQLERRILHGLLCEWEHALWLLDPQIGRRMKRPVFALNDSAGQWGSWRVDRREISLSRRLVLEHPWDAVRDVLLHEMAHQMAEEVLGAKNQPPHGPSFKKACALLRANPKASGTFPTLHQRLVALAGQGKNRTLVRIEKLMALAGSSNQHEAQAAMLKARELMARHHLEQLPHQTRTDFFSILLGNPALRHFREAYHLAAILNDFYLVQGIWVPVFVIEKGKMGRALEISGTASNVAIARYVYDFVTRFIDRQWEEYIRPKRMSRYRKTDFAIGILQGFRVKLEPKVAPGKEISREKKLAVINDPALNAYMAYRHPRTARFSRGGGVEKNVYEDGVKVGKKLVISKGIVNKGTGEAKRIAGK